MLISLTLCSHKMNHVRRIRHDGLITLVHHCPQKECDSVYQLTRISRHEWASQATHFAKWWENSSIIINDLRCVLNSFRHLRSRMKYNEIAESIATISRCWCILTVENVMNSNEYMSLAISMTIIINSLNHNKQIKQQKTTKQIDSISFLLK